jgi:hypothetical protein
MYERLKLYKLSPCDIGAFPPLRALGKFLVRLTQTECPCCTAARGVGLGALLTLTVQAVLRLAL